MKFSENQRIALNAVASYVRTFVRVSLALFTARWVLRALGHTDFGLYGAVGAIVSFVSFINSCLSGSVSRYYAYAIGESTNDAGHDDITNVRSWFNVALAIHIVIGVVFAGVGYVLGIYAVEHWISIPMDRIHACVWVFRFSILGVFVSIITVPFSAMFTAYQNITELVVYEILSAFLIFIGAYSLLSAHGDRLIVYSLMMVAITCLIQVIVSIRAVFLYEHCRIDFREWVRFSKTKEILSFASWKLLGVGAWMLRTQGSAVVINLLKGPTYNAAYSVANQLSSQSSTLAGALTNAFTPSITSMAGAGQEHRARVYAINACKFSSILTSCVAVPLICESSNLLDLWLVSPPAHAAVICSWFCLAFLIDSFSSGLSVAIGANGDIKLWQILESVIIALTLPCLFICYYLGVAFWIIGPIFAGCYAGMVIVRVYIARKLMGIAVCTWIKDVFLRSSLVTGVAFIVGCTILEFFHAGFLRLCLTTVVTLVTQIALAWMICLQYEDRERIKMSFNRMLRSIRSAA